MAVTFTLLAGVAGLCGFGFLLGGMMGFAFHDGRDLPRWLCWLSPQYYAFIFRWKDNKDARQAMLIGSVFILFTVLLGFIAFTIGD